MLLLCNVPTDVVKFPRIYCKNMVISGDDESDNSSDRKYERMRMIYSYFLYSFTLLHHFTRSFQSISLTLTKRVNHHLINLQCVWSEVQPAWSR
jgi:hypothetical protein